MNEINNIKSTSAMNMQAVDIVETNQVAEEQVQDNVEAETQNKKGPWTLWGDLKPNTTKCPPTYECTARSERELLTDILVKYGNNPEGVPPLHYAILQKDTIAIDLLLKHGSNPLTKDSKNRDCLYYAVRAGSLEIFKKFVYLGNNPITLAQNDYSPLLAAIVLNKNDIAKFILSYDHKDLDQNFIIGHCAWSGNYEIFELLLDRYKDIAIDYTRCAKTALEIVQTDNDVPIVVPDVQLAKQGKIKILETLIKRNLFTWFTDQYETINVLSNSFHEALVYLLDQSILKPNDVIHKTPLIILAARDEQFGLKTVSILLDRGANANAIGWYKRNVLFDLVQSGKVQKEMIQLLVKHGADINAKDEFGKTPLSFAKDPKMIEFLKGLGAK